MNWLGAPAHCWLLTLQYVCYDLNHISTASHGGQVPLQVLYGVTPDVSILLLYTFYQPVFYATHDQHFPLTVKRGLVSGLLLLNIVVTPSPTWFLILRLSKSSIEVLSGPGLPNIPITGLLMLEGRKSISLMPSPLNIQLQCDMRRSHLNQITLLSIPNQGTTSSKPLPEFIPDDLVGWNFLLPPGDNGERLRANITRKVVEDIEQADGERVQNLSFILGIGNGKLEEIISYNQL